MTPIVLRGDARKLPLADDSADLIVTSPPYYAMRTYTDGKAVYDRQIGLEPTPETYIAALVDCTREWVRVLKPEGSLWVNLGDKYGGSAWRNKNGTASSSMTGGLQMRAGTSPVTDRLIPGTRHKSLIGVPWRYAIACMDGLGLILRAEIIWEKPNGLPESVKDRVRRSHETWFHFVRRPHYYSSVDEIREPHKAWRASGVNALAGQQTIRPRGQQNPDNRNPLGKLPGSVWEISTEPLRVPDHLDVDHFAAFPIEWPRRIIQGWSPPGAVVLDPFGGTGTTALAASALGRIGISIDRSADYCRLAQWRTTDASEIARALRVPKPQPQEEGQESLFDLEGQG